MDTDSIILIDYPDDKLYMESIQTRNVLSCWVDEIKPKKHPETGHLRERYISVFTSGGPKNYGLEICWCNEDGTILEYEERVKESGKCVIRGFKKDRGDVTFDAMKNITFDSKKYACMSDLQRIKWARKQGIDIRPTTSGMVTLNPIKTKRFTISKGNGKSVLGIKNDGPVPDDSLCNELDEYFKLAPSGLERCY